jgi:hypothetical protein
VAAPRLPDEAAAALLVCFRLEAGVAAEFVDGDARLLTGPVRLLVTELTGEDDPADERELVPVEWPVTPSGWPGCWFSNGKLDPRFDPMAGSLRPWTSVELPGPPRPRLLVGLLCAAELLIPGPMLM